jgi:hypothetical protein
LVIFGVGPVATGPTFAHHAFAAEYDAQKKVTLKGAIVKMDWVNPHSWLYIDVKEPDGEMVTWALEFGPPQALYKRGWRKENLPVGEEVTVEAYLAKNGSRTANARNVVLVDGRNLFAGSSGTGAPDDK